MASLREFSKWAGDASRLLPDFKLPDAGIFLPHPLPGLNTDLQNMLDNCKNNMQRALISLLGLEGMRLHEARDVEVDDFDIRDMVIKIRGKGNKSRVVPITDRAWGYLAPRYIDCKISGCANLVTYSDRGARSFITELGITAGVSRSVSSHDLRATFATLAHQAGADVILIQAWLGHADTDTTRGYIGIDINQLRRAGSF